MEFIMLLLVLLVVVIALVASRFIDNSNPFQVQRKAALFSPVERSFLGLLDKAVQNDYRIMNRVRLADVLDIKASVSDKNRRSTQLKLNAKYLDYVLCEPETMKVVAVLDLVNPQNKEGHKAVPDWFVSGALDAAGVPYLRIAIKAGYTVTELQAALAVKLGKPAPKVEPLLKGLVKKGPTRPIRTVKPALVNTALSGRLMSPALSKSQIKAQSTALVQVS
ncbi:DUF2726 domain-containing protein [Alishewanella sp. 16-MA]|uniref:DUF2726 domain-containing protein n=1 Tax=Alishewanella maricola TaxID=2795740 RepID=A0ABS8C4F6_9ALTE|nr:MULTISPECIES: DUF2726 domain-containing protein [Gammaproteobacteria]MDP4944490.1 DUF2726 domain-containing protein [Alishewanella sp.]MDP5207421.1 DUF2726 domain-containing protein [Alishewanella sp. SMS9]MCB5227207.1 DUF2726 domain-containing protein [Alishewanella maricola]MCC5452513.1 DUF2726 domain-containing protein [Rheinheimera sp. UJ51]MCF4010332.1 DUF2726 domain-containing protein [Rheinheimera sp. UJ63]